MPRPILPGPSSQDTWTGLLVSRLLSRYIRLTVSSRAAFPRLPVPLPSRRGDGGGLEVRPSQIPSAGRGLFATRASDGGGRPDAFSTVSRDDGGLGRPEVVGIGT